MTDEGNPNMTCIQKCITNFFELPACSVLTAGEDRGSTIWATLSSGQMLSSGQFLTLKRLVDLVVTCIVLICSALSSVAQFLGLGVSSLFLIVVTVVYIYKKVYVPFSYVQDLDLPRAADQRKDMVNLSRTLRKIGQKLPPAYPNGWYGVVESSELKDGEVKEIHAFGESLAVFRGEGGTVHALDAHCPHLGANMAAGGSVRGDCLECPFHRWRFSGPSGKCVAIPGVDSVPKSAAVRAWESRELDGMVFVWFHCEQLEPEWELPSVPEIASGEWRYMARNDFLVPCHLQDIPENGADVAHLNALHGDHLIAGKSLPTSDSYNVFGRHVWAGQWAASEIPHIASVELKHDIRLLGKLSMVDVDVTATQVGASYVLMSIRHRLGQVMILQTVTPLTPLVQRVIHRLYAPWYVKPLANVIMWAETVMFHRDVMVWTSKQFVSNPLLVKTDRCLKAYRNWFKQFYTKNSTPFEEALRNITSPSFDW